MRHFSYAENAHHETHFYTMKVFTIPVLSFDSRRLERLAVGPLFATDTQRKTIF